MSETSDRIRREWGEADRKRDENLVTPDYTRRVDNIKYGNDPVWNLLDLYLPKKDAPTSGYPVIISIHGGGYVYGSKDIYQYYGASFCQYGYAFINFSYRLAPENRFPTALVDTNDVVKWMYDNADKYNLDTNNVFMVGDSAGGHYASLYSCLCINKEYSKRLNIEVPNNFKPNAVALNCGIYDPMASIETDPERTAYTNDLMGENWESKCNEYINTLAIMNSDFPPAFVMSATNDFLQGQVAPMDKKLTELSVPHIAKIFGEKGDETMYHVFHVNMNHPKAAPVNKEEVDFFNKYIR